MPATIEIHEMSALAAGVDKTDGTVRFKAADNAVVDKNDPIVIPDAGTAYSYTKKVRPYMADPPDTQISNLRWYTDGGNGFGNGVGVTAQSLGVTWGANYNTAMAGGADLFGYTQAAPLDGDGTDAGPFVPADDNSYVGDLIELQMAVDNTAASGTLPAETLTLAYDEI